ncbi:MAG: carboxypeptidase regulatory-like domain-containing protein, partial [Armatimonadetes bacterium]|nr:carboxypeptidase regulatory-like domain-containing protein [Armatimonadota bacterium]
MMSEGKRLLALATATTLAGLLIGCGGGGTNASLSGRVTDTRGVALQGVAVSVVTPVAGRSTVTDASGRFTLGGVPGGQTV